MFEDTEEDIDELVEKTTHLTLKLGGRALRYLMYVLVAYVFLGMIFLIYDKRGEFISQILTWSILGFWTFFFGYFGTLLAKHMVESASKTANGGLKRNGIDNKNREKKTKQ